MLIPVVYLDDIDSGSDGAGAADAGEAAAARVATLSHLGLCGPVALLAAADSAVPADPMAVKNCLRAAPCCVGPFVIREGDDSPVEQLLTWLNQGAATALLAPAPADGDETAGSASAEPRDGVDGGAAPSVGSGGALVRVASQLPVERVAVRLRAPAAPAAPGAAALAESTAVGSIRLLASALAELEPHAAAVASVASALVVAVPADCAAAAALLAPGEAVRLLARTVGGEELAAVEALRAAAKALRCEHIGSVAISVERSGAAVAVAPAAVGLLHACGLHVRAPATTEMIAGPDGDAKAPERTEIGASLAACLRSDRPDGLFTTVVTDESGVALGLVYSNELSIRTAVARARGVYWSRSRGGLWEKGATSGAYQELVAARVDCDSDALLVRVRQRGDPPAFCHLGTRSCWGDLGGVGALARTLHARRATAPEGSYTARLFGDMTLLRHKLLEEAQELAEATEPDHVAAETADVLYFALVRAAAAGVPLEAVEAHLDYRALKVKRRPGNAKPEMVAAAEALFASRARAAEAPPQ